MHWYFGLGLSADFSLIILLPGFLVVVTMRKAFFKVIVRLGPVVRRLDNAIHRINRYPVDKC